MNPHARPIKRSLLACVLLIGGAASLGATTASAATLQASGVQTPVSSGPCFDQSALASYTMRGTLIGCWYLDTFNPKYQSTTLQATGSEHFIGCIDTDGDQTCGGDDQQGTLYFSMKFTAKFDPLTGAEIHGRCQHPIIAATGDLSGATGVLTFKDDVTNGTSTYRGPVRL